MELQPDVISLDTLPLPLLAKLEPNLSSAELGHTITRTQFEELLERFVEEQDSTDSEGNELTHGQKLADKVADFGGSWTFIGIFVGIIVIWMAVNVVLLAAKAFDPYPFILLNLVLSCVAALQAPVIMMSQNRQEDVDRRRAKDDLKVNIKAEVEIRMLHEKIDRLLSLKNDTE